MLIWMYALGLSDYYLARHQGTFSATTVSEKWNLTGV